MSTKEKNKKTPLFSLFNYQQLAEAQHYLCTTPILMCYLDSSGKMKVSYFEEFDKIVIGFPNPFWVMKDS